MFIIQKKRKFREMLDSDGGARAPSAMYVRQKFTSAEEMRTGCKEELREVASWRDADWWTNFHRTRGRPRHRRLGPYKAWEHEINEFKPRSVKAWHEGEETRVGACLNQCRDSLARQLKKTEGTNS